jgi:hypothetical protein
MSKTFRKFDRQTANKIRDLKRGNRRDGSGDDFESYKRQSERQKLVEDCLRDEDYRDY